MANWADLSRELEDMLHLKTRPIAYRRLEKAEDLSTIKNVRRIDRTFTFCQVPFMARALGWTVGVTRDDRVLDRCMRLHGLKTPDEDSKKQESAMLSTTWLPSPEEGMRQQEDYPRIPAGEAIVVSPLVRERFEPEVVLVYGNPAQIMMIMCGLQKEKYERFEFFFIGEGACADSLPQCYVSGKPALAIPCYGERVFGQVADDEIVIALPPDDVERAVSGMRKLSKVGLRYPVAFIGGTADVAPVLARAYSDASRR